VPTTAMDFHGDGRDGEVCIIRTDGKLRNREDATISKPTLQQLLSRGNTTLPNLSCVSHLLQFFSRMFSSTNSLMCGMSTFASLLGREIRGSKMAGFRDASALNTSSP